MEQIRAKFTCQSVRNDGAGNQATFMPVTSGSEENEQFFKLTPGGTIDLYSVNPDVVFEPGKEYYVDFTLAETKAADLPAGAAIDEVTEEPIKDDTVTEDLQQPPINEVIEQSVKSDTITEEAPTA